MMQMNGLWPAVVASYDGPGRMCRVSIPGITDGSSVLPEAVFSNPLGDNAATTEIRILAGDPVWVMFECGDPRFPIITGYRTPRQGNPVDWRRWSHPNIEMTADQEFLINAMNLTIKTGANVRIQAQGNVAVDGATEVTVSGGSSVTVTAPTINLNGG